MEPDGEIPTLGRSPYQQINNLTITKKGIEKLLMNLKDDKSPGPDGIPPWFLKLGAEELSSPLQDLFQSSINTGIVPKGWKNANVAAIFKKGSRKDAANYRPVSLTPVICKVMEHIIHSHVMKHLENQDILSDNQHGFRAKKSTETQLILTIHDISKELNNNKLVDVALLDFTKAFDKVPHQRLIKKLEFYGLHGQIAAWVKSFLSGRSQQVVINGQSSFAASVSSGVPQGTVTGPLWFLIYINDLPWKTSCHTRLFADDCILYTPVTADQQTSILQNDLKLLEGWQDTWLMKFNPTKCCTMTIGKRNPPHHKYQFCDEELSSVDTHPYLGLHLSNTLKWNLHTKEVCNKAQRVQNVIRRNLWGCSKEVKATAYKSMVRPILEYASAAWDPALKQNINSLERIQRQAARFCTGNYVREEGVVTRALHELKWDTLQDRRKKQRLSMMYKMVNGLVTIPIQDYVQPNVRNTRGNNMKFRQIGHRAKVFQDSFFVTTVIDWNKLSGEIVNSPSLKSFKSKLKFD